MKQYLFGVTAPSIRQQGIEVPVVRAQDGSWQPDRVIQRAAALLRDAIEHRSQQGENATEDALRDAISAIPVGETAEAFDKALTDWMTFLRNGRKENLTQDPTSPTNTHNTQLWVNVVRYTNPPESVYPPFTGGYLEREHVKLFVDKNPVEPEWFLGTGMLDLRKHRGKPVTILRDTPALLPASLSASQGQQAAYRMARWVLLATMDNGGVQKKDPAPQQPQPQPAECPRSYYQWFVSSGERVGLFAAVIPDYLLGADVDAAWYTVPAVSSGVSSGTRDTAKTAGIGHPSGEYSQPQHLAGQGSDDARIPRELTFRYAGGLVNNVGTESRGWELVSFNTQTGAEQEVPVPATSRRTDSAGMDHIALLFRNTQDGEPREDEADHVFTLSTIYSDDVLRYDAPAPAAFQDGQKFLLKSPKLGNILGQVRNKGTALPPISSLYIRLFGKTLNHSPYVTHIRYVEEALRPPLTQRVTELEQELARAEGRVADARQQVIEEQQKTQAQLERANTEKVRADGLEAQVHTLSRDKETIQNLLNQCQQNQGGTTDVGIIPASRTPWDFHDPHTDPIFSGKVLPKASFAGLSRGRGADTGYDMIILAARDKTSPANIFVRMSEYGDSWEQLHVNNTRASLETEDGAILSADYAPVIAFDMDGALYKSQRDTDQFSAMFQEFAQTVWAKQDLFGEDVDTKDLLEKFCKKWKCHIRFLKLHDAVYGTRTQLTNAYDVIKPMKMPYEA